VTGALSQLEMLDLPKKNVWICFLFFYVGCFLFFPNSTMPVRDKQNS